ncbi:hypothetical protein [Glutamicibacter sp.]|jgi:hypothetical protein|uniref:hypothetical protein n=1 Tax=Glutamicibacter sp. TaxID=1931995 RepID=UPI002B492624|nr:hypothetical protein [Glutamicibacter sp.]HJX79135.1 hypothetical protein [Glutamicibacter sp.]
MAYEVSTTLDWTRQIQTSEETTKGTPVQNSTYKNIGIASKLTDNIPMRHEEVTLLGTEDIYDDQKLEEHNMITVSWLLIDTRFLRYFTEAAGGGAGSIDKTNTVLRSQKINNVANTKIYYGALPDRCTINLDKRVSCVGVMKCMSSTDWLTQAATDTAIGASTVYAPALTTTPWTHLTSGTSDPFTYNAVARDIEKGTIELSRNALEVMPLGSALPRTLRPGGRRIAFNFDTWVKDSALIGDVKNMTARTITMQLFTTPVIITLNNCKFNSYTTDSDSGAMDIYKETLVGVAKSISVTALTVAS